MHRNKCYNKTTPVWVDERASSSSLDAHCSWLCFPAGAPESALSCQAVFLADYHPHPKKLDHEVIQPIFIHRHIFFLKNQKHQHTHKHTQSQACSVTLQFCRVISLSTDSEIKPVVSVSTCVSVCVCEPFNGSM